MQNVRRKKFMKGPPPFLEKLFNMVEDPNTDKLISWGQNSRSLIIWDQFKFSDTLLPKNFKHNNFSSFIYQLNSYGFRKVDYDRWEYANIWFRAGEKELLGKIKRRKTNPQNKRRRKEVKEIPFIDPISFRSMEVDMEYLKNEKDQHGIKIKELRKSQDIFEHQLRNIESKIDNEMPDLILEAFVKSQEKFGKTKEPKTSYVALSDPSLLQDDDLADHGNEGEGELTQSQLKILLVLKEIITKKSV